MANAATILDIERRDYPSKHYVYVILTDVGTDKKLIFRRYQTFFELQTTLLQAFPEAAGQKEQTRILPHIPGKILFGRSHIKEVAMARLPELDTYLRNLVKLPVEISRSKPVEKFFQQTSDDINCCRESNNCNTRRSAISNSAISEPVAIPRALVRRAHTKSSAEEVSVSVGQEVEVIEQVASGWAKVHVEICWGWVPVSCLSFIERRQDHDACADRTLHLVVRQNQEMGLRLGTLVFVTEQREDGWWRLEGQSQRVPGVCLAPVRKSLLSTLEGKLRKKEKPPRPPPPRN